MKEELQAKLVEILASIQQATGQAKDFAIRQLPDVAQSYILYGRVRTTAEVVALAVIMVAALSSLLWAFRAGEQVSDDRRMCAGLIGGFLSLASVGLLFIAVSDAALVWLAPKVWLLREIAHMVK